MKAAPEMTYTVSSVALNSAQCNLFFVAVIVCGCYCILSDGYLPETGGAMVAQRVDTSYCVMLMP